MEAHSLARSSDDRYTCRVCGWSWDHLPASPCPGLQRYRSLAEAPADLAPALVRRGTARGCVATGDGWLYLHDRHDTQEERDRELDARLVDAQEAAIWAACLLRRPDHWVALAVASALAGEGRWSLTILSPRGTPLLHSPFHLTTLTPAAPRVAPSLAQISPLLAAHTAGKTVVCYHSSTPSLLEAHLALLRLPPLQVSWQCAQEAHGRWAGDYDQEQQTYRPQPLPGATGRSEDDAQALLALLGVMAGRLEPVSAAAH